MYVCMYVCMYLEELVLYFPWHHMGVDKGAACAAFAASIILVGAACRTNYLEEN